MSQTPLILTRRQVRRLDALAVTDLRFPSIVLMENAGKNAADWIRRRYADAAGTVHVFCGPGNNGGDGFVIARHLHNAGYAVRTYLVGDPRRLTPDANTNHAIASAMNLPIVVLADAEAIGRACPGFGTDDLLVDALLGTGFSGSVREPAAEIVRLINAAEVRGVIGVDVPSGLDCDTGEVGNVAVRADATITFAAAKRGFETESARPYVGEVVVVDIGTPPALIRRALAEENEAP